MLLLIADWAVAIMYWNNLDRNRCPKCNRLLDFESDKEMMMCTISCGFMINPDKMKKIVAENQFRRLENNNQEKLNEL